MHHLWRLLLTREAFEPASRLFSFFRQSPLGGTPARPRGLSSARPTTLALGFLFLPARQFLEALHHLVDLVVRTFLLPSLHRLVLVLQFVELEFEQVSQIFGRVLAATAATTATAALLDSNLVVGFLSPLQMLQCPLLSGKRRVDILSLQCRLGRFHFRLGPRENRENRAKRWVGWHYPAIHPA